MENLFDRYKKELEEDLKLDDFNLKDTQLRLPTLKHKWVARLIDAKIEKNRLIELRKEAIIKVIETIRSEKPITVSDRLLIQHAEQNEIIVKIDKQIKMCDLIIDYLEKVEVICKNTTFDIKNVIEIRKLQLL
ncbi:MAG: Recombination, repair and ssDNA binding protein UvsY [Bacteroidetes bacterium ADurb.Bin217]|nr:MAG: Recombination, repair and ssDNA binding protein UvsY [Bacteroidetes bacterium ADurb.Bin217]